MFYAVKKGREPGIYEDKEKALAQIFKFPFSEMRTFKNKKDAEKYLKKESSVFYVVKKGHTPGIYITREELAAQVRDYPNPFVKTFKDEQAAQKFLLEDVDDLIRKKEERDLQKKMKTKISKEDYLLKIEGYLKNGISVHSRNICFIDVEANKGYAISLGAVIYDTEKKEVIETFYQLMKYDSFKKMDSYCERIHHIKTEDILQAKSSDEIYKEFISLINKYEVKDIFAWGNTDKGFLRKTLTDKSLTELISPIRNIQTFISFATKDILFNNRWALKDMKRFYGISGEVSHNALDDAKDLMKVYQCFQDKKNIKEEVVLSLKNN